jgi:CheY-like chemotaxis protein
MMDGAIGFSSEINIGSKLWFELPVSTSQDASLEPGGNEKICDFPNSLNTKGQHNILCVEDNAINVALIESLFEDDDDIVLIVTDCGEKALELAAKHKPDLILMDIGLIGMDGIETTRLLKQRGDTKNIPVIALSAAAMQDDLKLASEVGFLTYITKPIRIGPFLASVNLALGREN